MVILDISLIYLIKFSYIETYKLYPSSLTAELAIPGPPGAWASGGYAGTHKLFRLLTA
jgi:hypothetical protein